jgi:hypothetical protein
MGMVSKVDFDLIQNLCDKKAATTLAQSETSIMVVFLFNGNVIGDMAISHQVK